MTEAIDLAGRTDIASQAKALCDDPAAFFEHSFTKMQSIDRDRLAALQREGLRQRFADLKDRVPMLKKLADAQEIAEMREIDDVVPLLFEHTMYKSYPPAFLEKGRFAEINKFLSKLTTFDLTGIDVSECQTIDDWMELMDRESPLVIMHSSGTSGTMTFLPISKHEWDKFGKTARVIALQEFGDDPSVMDEGGDFYVIYPYFRHGGSGHVRTCDLFVKYVSKTEERLLVPFPGRMSSDLLYLAARIQAAAAKGELEKLDISPVMMARKAEYEALQAEMPARLDAFFTDIAENYQGKRIFFWGAQNLLFNLVRIGQEKGLSRVFAPNSVIGTGGDSKNGVKMPEDWRQQVCDFIGIENSKMCYGMTEVKGWHKKCSHGHYHFCPWIIPFLLDPDTSELLPRKGRAMGRAAFFDLGSETRWGGFITGDEVTIEWDEPCGCGQSTVYAMDGIERLSAKRGGDDKISCAATEGAHKEAMSFLTSFQ
ncbi:hypothetical protein [Sphingobium sp. EM0848]|uniref:hypothetical protein n=1 Tax=Sphingobium sp. EM0848 TaxID=2743473 RepID=UPI00159CA425|nr:hypothetical protein [Sphingobium sp. EM0848]